MNKKLVALSLGIMTAMSTVAFAAPATDLSAGKVAIDLSITKPDVDAGIFSGDKKTNFDFGITAGLGNKWGIQYKHQNGDSDTSASGFKTDGKVQELNVLYQIDKNFTAFVGMNKLSGNAKYTPLNASFSIDDANKWQLGVTGTTKLGDQLSGWATVAAGSDNFSYELGLAQALSKDWDLNLFYRHKKFDSVKLQGMGTGDVAISGFGLGVTAKF